MFFKLRKEKSRHRKGKKIVTKRFDVLHEVALFYEQLYTSKNVPKDEVKKYFECTVVNRLTEKEKELCGGLLTNTECRKAAFKMPTNKTPGGNGLSTEFYQEFWNDIEFICLSIH